MSRRSSYQEPEPFREHMFFFDDIDPKDLKLIVFALLDHLKLNAIKTNQTKHGDIQILLVPDE